LAHVRLFNRYRTQPPLIATIQVTKIGCSCTNGQIGGYEFTAWQVGSSDSRGTFKYSHRQAATAQKSYFFVDDCQWLESQSRTWRSALLDSKIIDMDESCKEKL